ncbi:hypothetical protein [Cypionkella sp.]|jgi:hypothetical protein|uniref:hypothetical protein n=1 Tax=Cypionkella sp. TaxID=2811411 RepID=UPI002724F3E5|nr:hypothetical protein [Cypionkella sp.]MDO8982018.1 hypothetical protein [Cypionkella sp.]MDP2051199.1 hypothetical protein [Cypionkella sp.]
MDRVLGLDSGGSKTEAVVINRAGRVLARVGRRVWGCWQQTRAGVWRGSGAALSWRDCGDFGTTGGGG